MKACSTFKSSWGCSGQSFQASKDAREGKDWEIKMLYDGGEDDALTDENG